MKYTSIYKNNSAAFKTKAISGRFNIYSLKFLYILPENAGEINFPGGIRSIWRSPVCFAALAYSDY